MNIGHALPNMHIDNSIVIQKEPTVCAPDCPICGGVGLVRSQITDIYDPRFGKLTNCPNIDAAKIYGPGSGLVPSELSWGWDKIIINPVVKPAIEATKRVTERGYGWVILWGDSGNAKTLIEKIVVAQAIQAKKEAAYCRMVEVINDLRAAFDADNPSRESQLRLDRWTNIPVLCIDEFDRVNTTEFSNTKRFELMDRRHVEAERGNSVTIIAMNANPNDPSKFETYLRDRFATGWYEVIELKGPSFRPLIQNPNI